MTYEIHKPKPRGRPPSPAARARFALPCCEKCRWLEAGTGAPECTKGHQALALCADYHDVSRDRSRMAGGLSGKVTA